MAARRNLVTGFLGLFTIALLAAGLLYAALRWIRGLDPNVATAILAAMVAAVGAIYSQRKSRLREIEEAHRPQKVAVYNIYMDIIDRVLQLSRDGATPREGEVPPELEPLFHQLRRGFLIWASPKVIQAYETFRLRSTTDPDNLLLYADDVFTAIRADLRNSNLGLRRGDLIKLFLKDPSELDRMIRRR